MSVSVASVHHAKALPPTTMVDEGLRTVPLENYPSEWVSVAGLRAAQWAWQRGQFSIHRLTITPRPHSGAPTQGSSGFSTNANATALAPAVSPAALAES